MLSDVAAVVEAQGIEFLRVGDVVRFTAGQVGELSVLASPIAEWWQRNRPTTAGDVVLRFVGPNGVNEIGYCAPDFVVAAVRHTIEVESGRVYEPGEAPGPARRFAAGLLRRARVGFTATEVAIRDEYGVVWVGLSGREMDDRPRSVEFQAYNPNSDDYDPEEDEGYCVVNEDHIPVYGGLVSLRLEPRALQMQLTGEAARRWGLRSATLTVKLRLSSAHVEQLRSGLRRIFASRRTGQQLPELDLG